MKCNQKTNRETVVIEYTKECLDCPLTEVCTDSKTNNINVYLSATGATPTQLLWLLSRTLIGPLIAVSSNMADILYNACHMSANLAEEIRNFKDDKFGIKLHVTKSKGDLN